MKQLIKVAFALIASFCIANPAAAKVNVVTANQDLSWVTAAVGGNRVSVDYLAKSGEDPHRVDPRPSQVVKISNADAIVRIGMDLDIWFDSLIRASGNGKVVYGGRGYIDASTGINALEVPSGKLDPSRGDIHIFGNPHYLFAPSNVRIVARTIADGLKKIDKAGSAVYDANYTALVSRLNQAITGWKARLAKDRGKSVVTYHKSLVYFLSEFGIKEFGNVEPRPGLEPTPGHVSHLAGDMKQDGVRVILTENFRRRRYADLLARQSGGQVVVLPGGIGAEKGTDDYFTFMSTIVERVASAL